MLSLFAYLQRLCPDRNGNAVSTLWTLDRRKRARMQNTRRSVLRRYGMVPLAVLTALLLRLLLWPLLGAELPFLLLWPAVMFCAWYGGFGPGFLATFLSVLAAHTFLLESRFSFALSDPNGMMGMGLFVLLGICISLLCERLRQAKRRVEEHAQQIFHHREWLRVTLESIGDGVIATDTAGCITFMNSVAQSLTGWSQREAQGQLMEIVLQIVNEETRQPVENPVRKVLQTDVIVGLANHTVLIDRNGHEKPIDDSAAPIRGDADQTLGVVMVFRDVTERRQRMQELAEADQRKSQFLAMLGHELRNPLAPARNALALLRHIDPKDSKFEWAQEVLHRQIQQMARLVDDLLDVSRINTGKVRLRKEAVELGDILERAVEISRPLIEARRHELTEALPSEPVWLEADPTRLAQVFSNLLNNAAKYTEEGGHIWLTAQPEGSALVVQVRDNGIGIAPEMLPHIFDLFTQADHSLAHSQGGLGLGLTLVHKLLEMHGGSVRAFSAGLGKGSTFEVRLPILEKRRGPSPISGSDAPATPSTGQRILVVDDNHDASETLAMLLRMLGHDVHMAYDGLAALELAQRLQPDVVILDIGLPKMNGYEVACRLRQLPGLKKRPLLVALTGYGHAEDRRCSGEAGFDYHLVKPVDPDTLQALITCSDGKTTASGAAR
jgi:PAS domain S-box-containing protein